MAYNANIPAATDLLSVSQGQILANFQAIQTLIDVNHVDFADAGNMGKHKFVTFIDQTALPPVATGTDINIYNAQYTYTPQVGPPVNIGQQLFDANLAGIIAPFTASVKASPGFSWLPSGILLQWGTFATPAGGIQPFFLKFPNACLSVTLTSNVGGSTLAIFGITQMNFTVVASGSGPSGYFFAIGF